VSLGRSNGDLQSGHRKCPAGSPGRPPFTQSTNFNVKWNAYVGANFGAFGEIFSAPFIYGDHFPAPRATRIASPSDAMLFMDTFSHFVYTPAHPLYRFTRDANGDGIADSASNSELPFNAARPTIHNNGANVALLDGRVERVPFKELWRINSAGQPTHSYWLMDD
jgi:prepilin-type processing-associated H-X9-DG protein